MVAGLPGTGIGGIFYLLTALLMPVRETVKLARGKSSRKNWRRISKQCSLAGGIIFGFFLTGIILTAMFPTLRAVSASASQHQHVAQQFIYHPFFFSLSTLLFVLMAVEVIALTNRCYRHLQKRKR